MAETTADASGRDARLVTLLRRARRGGLQPEGWVLVAGGALVVGGLALVIIGWVGTSRTVLVAGQIPYVVSGGLLGVALVFLGAFLYFGYWMAMLVRQSREDRVRAADDAARLEGGIAELNRSIQEVARLLQKPEEPPLRRRRSAAAQPAPMSLRVGLLVATPAGTMVHRPDCPVVANRDDLRDVTGNTAGLRPCGICNPLRVS
jgi:hypothetical protein